MIDLAPHEPNRLVFVTGPSGAGRTTAINALEDMGFEAIDNLPLSLIPRLLSGPLAKPLALGVDPRNRDFSAPAMLELLSSLTANPDVEAHLVYLDARADVLLRRFSETRRRHPLAPNGAPREGIEKEFELLAPVRKEAEFLLDTSELSPHDLRAEIARWFAVRDSTALAISLQSFSYKRGLPRGGDIVFDCRFLKNPHWEEALRAKTGQSADVSEYVQSDPRFGDFYAHISALTEFLLPAFQEEGKAHLNICFGCTGGKHRSVAVAEILGKALANKGWQVSIRHREMEGQANASGASV
jgi:UPF0042 nucleotide-binding protein